MDRLEKYIKENRDSLDIHEPPTAVWERISRKTVRKGLPFYAVRAAAAILLLLISGAGLLYFTSGLSRAYTGSGELETQVLRETEIYYNSLQESLYQKAEPMLAGQPEIEKELRVDMAHLDSICSEIKKDLKDNVANQEVIEALIQNYAIKIQLLEDLLDILKENEIISENGESYEL